MGFLEKVGGFAGKAGEKISKAATGAADKSKLLAEKAKLKSHISTENSNISKAYTELGKKYFELFAQNPAEDFAEIVGKINDANAHIAELQQQLAALDVETTCPIRKDQQFCQSCGAKMESFVDVAPEDLEVVVEAVEEAKEDTEI